MQDPQRLLLLALLNYAAQKNVSTELLCRLIGLDMGRLKQTGPLGLTAKQLDNLWVNVVQLSHDPLFGLHFGETMQLTALGVVGGLVQTSRTIGEALTQAAAFTSLVTDMMTMTVFYADGTMRVVFTPHEARRQEAPVAFQQQMDLFMAFTLHEVDGLVLKRLRPTRVLCCEEMKQYVDYQRVFRCDVLKQSTQFALEFDGAYWHEPIVTANYELQTVLLNQAQAWSSSNVNTLYERIHHQLLANAYLGIPTLEDTAANLNMSSRSLQRKLQQEGVTYQQLTDSIRKYLAINYIEAKRHPVKEVAYLLGYNELSAFTRAFKRWTGRPPIRY